MALITPINYSKRAWIDGRGCIVARDRGGGVETDTKAETEIFKTQFESQKEQTKGN